jgi:hypothetical protein
MQTTIILAIIAIVAGAVTSLIPIQQVSALLGQGSPSNFPHSSLGALKGDLGADRGNIPVSTIQVWTLYAIVNGITSPLIGNALTGVHSPLIGNALTGVHSPLIGNALTGVQTQVGNALTGTHP